MANEEQLRILQRGADAWNKWKAENLPKDAEAYRGSGGDFRRADHSRVKLERADLSWADLSGANLSGALLMDADIKEAILSGANLSRAVLFQAKLMLANLSEADLSGANLNWANLSGADLSGANLSGANLSGADLSGADLSGANLSGALLYQANLVGTNLERSILIGCHIWGISAWNLNLEGAQQNNLIITPSNEPAITVDNLEVAQFIYLLINNKKLRDVIDTIGKKAVLILGRFTPERKPILDAIKEELRKRDYLPVLFDFEGPKSRDLTETVSTLAHMARFVIADITDGKSIPAELQSIVPQLPSVPVQPLILDSDYEYALFEHIQMFPWVLETYRYGTQEELLASIEGRVIGPAEAKANEIRSKAKSQE
jgi:uncharacterized protein YjbI with pentapeptide repeats